MTFPGYIHVLVAILLTGLIGCSTGPDRIGLRSAGEARSYLLVAPPGDERAPRPLVIALHGWLGTPEQMAEMSGLSSAASKLGFVVVYPEGEWWSWDFGLTTPRGIADAAFLSDVVADVSSRMRVDSSRVYVAGFSNGGFMAQALACSGRLRLAGVAVIASGLAAPTAMACKHDEVPFLLIQGTDDPIVPVAGTDTREGRILPTEETLAFWGTDNHCHGFDRVAAVSKEPGVAAVHLTGRTCAGGETEAWLLDGGGHVWPGSGIGYPEFLVGRRTSVIDATSVLLGFLLRQVAVTKPQPL